MIWREDNRKKPGIGKGSLTYVAGGGGGNVWKWCLRVALDYCRPTSSLLFFLIFFNQPLNFTLDGTDIKKFLFIFLENFTRWSIRAPWSENVSLRKQTTWMDLEKHFTYLNVLFECMYLSWLCDRGDVQLKYCFEYSMWELARS